MRTFIALALPEEFEEETADLARQLSALVSGRIMPRANYHVTLAFLGETDEVASREVIGALDEVARRHGSVTLRPSGLGSFGKPRDCTLWLGLEPSRELIALADDVRDALDACGITFDRKPFRPHLTLARRAALPRAALEGLVFPREARASRLVFYKSILTQEGATYKELYAVELSDASQ